MPRLHTDTLMRLLPGLLLLDRQIRGLFREDGRRLRFFPAGPWLPGFTVNRTQRRRIEREMPPVYARLIAIAIAGNLATVGGIILWDRFVGYVDALAALGTFAAVFLAFSAILHVWLFLSVRRVVRDREA